MTPFETTGEPMVGVVVEGLPEWDYIAAPEAVVHKVRIAIERFQLLQPGKPVVVGVSGGPDSLTLLHALWRLREEFRWQIVGAHLNHGLRGAEADEDEAFVKNFCEGLGVPCVTRKVDVRAIAHQRKLSISQAGRRERYHLFAEVAQKFGATEIALGHTASDVVETVLLNLLRGTGIDGLQGIPPKSPLTIWDEGQGIEGEGKSADFERSSWHIVRPLLLCWRAETEGYAKVYRLQPRQDKGNLDTKVTRNWVRWVLLPLLRQRFPKVDGALWRLSEMVRDESEWLNALADERLNALTLHADGRKIVVARDAFLKMPKALQRRVLKGMVERLAGELNEVSFEHLEAAVKLIERHPTDAALHLPSQLFLKIAKGTVWLMRVLTDDRQPF